MKRSLLILVLFFLPTSLKAETKDLPKPTSFVSDFAQVMAPEEVRQLSLLLSRLEQASGIEMAVVTIPSLEGEDIEGYAVRLFKSWGIGKKGKDNGVLLLAAIQDHAARIEVGYGLEPVINDAYAGRVLREVLFPNFRNGNYGKGLMEGSRVLIGRLGEQLNFSLEGGTPHALSRVSSSGWAILIKIIIFVVLLILFIQNPFLFFLLLSGGRGGGDDRGSGGFGGGGFGGFGGGGSGGGGASGSW